MTIGKRAAVLAVTLLALLGVGAVASTPAHAAWSDCDYGRTCFYNSTGGVGTPYESTPQAPNHSCTTLPTSWRNVASSVYNRVPDTRIRYFAQTSCQGGAVLILTFGQQRSLFVPSNANNNIESYEVCYTQQSNCSLDDGPAS